MNFSVKFFAPKFFAWQIDSKHGGLDLLDKARQDTGLASLSPHRVSNSVPSVAQDPILDISEEAARASGRFSEKSEVWVRVQKGWLNQFSQIFTVTDRSPESGEIILAKFEHRLDNDAVIGAWEEAGYPSPWESEE